MRMMDRNIKLKARATPRLAVHTHNLHLVLAFLLSFLLFLLLLLALIILQLPSQPSHNFLYARLALLKGKVPTPIPPPRFLVRFNGCPFPQLSELGLTERPLRRFCRSCCVGVPRWLLCTSRAATRYPVFDAGIKFCAQELLEGVCLRATWVLGARVGD